MSDPTDLKKPRTVWRARPHGPSLNSGSLPPSGVKSSPSIVQPIAARCAEVVMVAVVVRGAGDVLGEMRTGGEKRRGLGFTGARVGWGMGLPPSRGEKWGFCARSLKVSRAESRRGQGFARGVSRFRARSLGAALPRVLCIGHPVVAKNAGLYTYSD